MLRERLALDTSLWKTPEQAEEDYASYLLENKLGPLVDRINYVELKIDNDGDLAHPHFGKIKSAISVKTELDRLELKAVDRLTDWANKNSEGVSIWISPPYPDQDESRFIIYELGERSGVKTVALHSICGLQDIETCLSIAQQLSAFCPDEIDMIEREEQLRETPIPFVALPPYPDWTYLLKDLIYPPEIWETIRKGEHIKRKKEALNTSKQVVGEHFVQISKAASRYEHIRVGAKMEARSEVLGFKVQDVGPCGISNTLALSLSRSRDTSPFTYLHSTILQVESHFPCPKCKEAIPSGKGITKCPHCGARKEEFESKCD